MGKTQSKGVVKTQVSVGAGKAPVKSTGGGKIQVPKGGKPPVKPTVGEKTTKVPNDGRQKQWNHQANIKNHNNTTLDHNNDAYKKATDNHANQLNQNNQRFQGGESKDE